MDAEVLDFPDQHFDAVVCRWGLMFLPNLGTSLSEIHRVLQPGTHFATSVWDVPPKVPFISMAFRLAQEMFELPPPPPGTPTLFGLAQGNLEQAMEKAGFTNIHSETLTVTTDFASVEELCSYLRDIAAPIMALLANQTVEKQAQFWDAFSDAARTYANENGQIQIPNSTICVVGKKS